MIPSRVTASAVSNSSILLRVCASPRGSFELMSNCSLGNWYSSRFSRVKAVFTSLRDGRLETRVKLTSKFMEKDERLFIEFRSCLWMWLVKSNFMQKAHWNNVNLCSMLLSITLSYFMELWNSGNFAINVWKDQRLKPREGLWCQTDLCRTIPNPKNKFQSFRRCYSFDADLICVWKIECNIQCLN